MSRSRFVGALAALVLVAAGVAQGGPEHVVQYQGRLTDSNGVPREGTIGALTFRLYSTAAPTSASFLWGERHVGVPANRGVFTVLLGGGAAGVDAAGAVTSGPNPFVAEFDGEARYLQVQVDGDAPLAPLTRLGSVPFAVSAGGSVPIGTVVDWFPPAPGALPPAGWVVCDGRLVDQPENQDSPFFNRRVPDLVGRFTSGLPASALGSPGYGASPAGAPPLLPAVGGSDVVSQSHNHGISAVPDHSHSIPMGGAHDHSSRTGLSIEPQAATPLEPVPGGVTNPAAELGFQNARVHRHEIPSGGDHNHGGSTGSASVTGTTTTQDQSITFDNRPPFVGLLKIIRVR